MVPEACFFLQESLCLQGEAAQGAVTTKGEGAMAFLTEPAERYQASYLEALQEFQAEGRHLEPPLEEIAADFARFVQHLRELADHTKLKPGWVPGSDFWLIDGSDYIGSAVNIASRVADAATAGQILLTATTTQRIEAHGIAAQEVGARLLRGVDEPVNLYRVVEVREERDPMCGKIVAMDGALRLANVDGEIFFCSQECLVAYLDPSPTDSDARH